MLLSSSIGIIGGADGPTAIFLTGSSRLWLVVAVLFALGLIAGAVAGLYWFIKKK